MAIVVEDGTGLTNANSYISVAESDDYANNTFYVGEWNNLAANKKEVLLINATRFINSFYDFNGEKAFPTASLRWPRTGVCDLDGVDISSTIVPAGIKNATSEMAIFLASNNLLEEDETLGISSVKVDTLAITFERSEKGWRLPSTVNHYIRGLGHPMSNARVGTLIAS